MPKSGAQDLTYEPKSRQADQIRLYADVRLLSVTLAKIYMLAVTSAISRFIPGPIVDEREIFLI